MTGRSAEQGARSHQQSFSPGERGVVRSLVGAEAAARAKELFPGVHQDLEAVAIAERIRPQEESREIYKSPYNARRTFSQNSQGFDGDSGVYGNAAKED